MYVICKKRLSGITQSGIFILFKEGERYDIYGEEDGRDYLLNHNWKFYFSHRDKKFLEHFDIIDEELEEITERLEGYSKKDK